MSKTALIIGAGEGLSAAVARRFAAEGIRVGLAARNTGKLQQLATEIDGQSFMCDATQAPQVATLFEQVDAAMGGPDILVFNAGYRRPGAITEIQPDDAEASLRVNAMAPFLAAQQAARRMLKNGHGTMLFTGASAGIKGYARSAPFAMGKFALRGLCQSLARELHPQNIHVVHFVIDGIIRNTAGGAPYDDPAITLDPDAIAQSYLALARQDKSAWSWEMELRPNVENF